MPLRLVPPREGKTPNYYIRGTHHRVSVNTTAGTADRAEARKVFQRIKTDIEHGAFTPRTGLTFAQAALSYLRAGGEDTFLGKLTDHFGNTKLADIDQAAIDEAAHTLYPTASPATRNRQVYTPLSAILKHAKVVFPVSRPKGAEGEQRTGWLWEEDAFRLLDAAEEVDPELRTFLAILLYTGLRLSEAIWLKVDNVRISESFAYVPKTKNEAPRPIHLPPALVAELANHPRGMDRPGETVCRFRKNGYLYGLFGEAKKAARVEATFHTFRHTWATWMRRYAKLDVKGLVDTGAWKDAKSAARYQHVVLTEEARRSDLLPVPKRGKSVDNG
jgi:integrase